MTTPEPRKSGLLELPRGTAIGKYEILRKLATGGMAEIYLARVSGTAGFEKLVVLKRILPTIAEDPRLVQMFLDEARLAATLRHPNIADVYDVGDDDGIVFFTMEFVHGQDVRTVRQDAKKRNDPVPLGVALAIVHGTASALEHAHELTGPDGKHLGLVHRDVSTSNVMVSYDGAVKLLDFGIARASSSTHKTQTGMLKGKIAYMSPEQCRGTPLDRRSDLFSLGIVMFELTVGRRPFRGDTDFAIMDQIVYQGAPKPSSIRPDYPPELEAIVMKLLDRNPALRYPTAEDLLHDLDEYIGANGLWQSPRAIGKYMRTLFADKIVAWEQAEQEGVSFAQHVAQSITSQSQRVELMTPSKSFPGVEPRPSQRHMLAHAPTAAQDVVAPPPEPAAPLPVAKLESAPVAYPSIRPSRAATFFKVLLALLVLGGAGAAGFILTQNRQQTEPTAKDEPAPAPAPVPAPVPAPAVAEEPKVEQPKEEPKVEEPKVEEPKVEEPKVEAKTEEPAVEAKVEQPVKKTTGKHVVKKTTTKKTTTKTDATKTDATKVDKTPPKQDPSKPFDPDSPFLPQ
ncbi:MAG TPA: protein kinase [Kofleriaceae bacterium]|nr:protein kinase [Kofleriaceae bacterium]